MLGELGRAAEPAGTLPACSSNLLGATKGVAAMNGVPTFVSDSRAYDRIHYAARKIFSGRSCDRCNKAPVHAALRPSTPRERLCIDSKGFLFSFNLADYHPLCIPCHRKVDLRIRCRARHEFSDVNTSVKRDGSRRCLVCHRERERARLRDGAHHEAKLLTGRRYCHAHQPTPGQKARKLLLQRRRRQIARFEHGDRS